MRRFWLPAILILAFFLRFINLENYPVGFNADEASFGYDAYSIIQTGRDQWGNFLPLSFKSFGDYKAAIYGYLAVPFVATLGLTPIAVRLPNVIVGTLAVYVLYLLTLELKNRLKIKYDLEFISSLFLAISPWSIMLSRGAFEANLITLFIPLGVYLFLKDKLNLSALVFGLSLFAYHSSKVLSPLIFFGLLIVFKIKKPLAILIYLIFLTSTIWILINGAGVRISERSITNGALEEGASKKIELINNGYNPFLAKIMHNKYQVVVIRFVNNYKQYFSTKFLFSQGAGESYYGMIHGIGVVYLFEGIMFLGLVNLVKVKKIRRVLVALSIWLIIAPIPGALSSGIGFSGHRSAGMIPVLQILSSLGAYGWYQILKDKSKITKRIFTFCIAFLISINLAKFINIYFKNIPDEPYKQMLYANLEVSKWLIENANEKKVIVSRSLSEPQIFIAFAGKINPVNYQTEANKWKLVTWVDQIPEYKLNNYIFKSIDWETDTKTNDTVIVARPGDFPKGVLPDKIFSYPDGSPNIYVKYY